MKQLEWPCFATEVSKSGLRGTLDESCESHLAPDAASDTTGPLTTFRGAHEGQAGLQLEKPLK
jgi:hypothetical protein